jgi:uncharacterized protein (TIGR02598 family)
MNSSASHVKLRQGFSLVEVTLAIGIVGIAILSLVGILGSTFQQVDDIMQTNRALAGVSRLIGALDNPRSIVYLDSTNQTDLTNQKWLLDNGGSQYAKLTNGNDTAPNFDIAYRLLAGAKDTSSAVWLYVYERKIVSFDNDKDSTGAYKLSSNPSVIEVAFCDGNNLTQTAAAARNIIGTPMRVRLSLSKLLVGQRPEIDTTTLEPKLTRLSAGALTIPEQPVNYALAYLPVVAEFFPHDYSAFATFSTSETQPILVQNIVLSR